MRHAGREHPTGTGFRLHRLPPPRRGPAAFLRPRPALCRPLWPPRSLTCWTTGPDASSLLPSGHQKYFPQMQILSPRSLAYSLSSTSLAHGTGFERVPGARHVSHSRPRRVVPSAGGSRPSPHTRQLTACSWLPSGRPAPCGLYRCCPGDIGVPPQGAERSPTLRAGGQVRQHRGRRTDAGLFPALRMTSPWLFFFFF